MNPRALFVVSLGVIAACGGGAGVHGGADAGTASTDAAPSVPVGATFSTASAAVIRQRLARFLWADESAAGDVVLDRDDGDSVGAAAERMMNDSRARQGMAAFAGWWWATRILTGRDRSKPPVDELRADLAEEIHRTFVERVFSPTGRFGDLLLAPTTFVNRRLASLYGMTKVSGDGFQEVSFPAPRKGMPMSIGALTIYSSPGIALSWPPKRGWMINQVLTCTQPFESNLPSIAPEAGRSIRGQLIDLTRGSCQGCHRVLDEPGFAFIGFDGQGRPLADDLGFAIDPSGRLRQLPGEPHFKDAFDMLERLAATPEVHRCFAQHVLHYALDPRDNPDRATPPAELDETLTRVAGEFQANGLTLRPLFSIVARTDAFRAGRAFEW